MSICPNLSDPKIKEQWDALEQHPQLGRMEAMREFMEAELDNRGILSPEQVIEKLASRGKPKSAEAQQEAMDAMEKMILAKSNDPSLLTDPNSLYGAAALFSDINTKTLDITSNSNTRGIEVATKLAQQLGIGFQVITPEEAVRLTGDSANPYNATKGPAFFYQGTVYFIGSMLNTQLAFHEFSHPLVRTIQQQNPALFQKLVNQGITADPSLLESVKQEYADLLAAYETEQDPQRKAELADKYQNIIGEELLVRALSKAAVMKDNNAALQGPFQKFINDLLYAIKQLFRKAFGKKVEVSKLDANTTLDELADMLVKGDEFSIDTNAVSDKDVVAYAEEFSSYLDDLNAAVNSTGGQYITDLARKMYEGASRQIELLIKNRNYREMLEIFVDDYNRGDLQEMRSNVAKYAKQLQSKMEELAEDVNQTRNETTALVTSILRLEVMMKKMKDHLTKLETVSKKTPTTLEEEQEHKDLAHKAEYYSHVLTYWQKYVTEAKAMMRKAGADPRSPMTVLLNSIEGTMEQSAEKINTIKSVGISEVLWDQWREMSVQATKLFNDQVALLKRKGANKSVIDKAYIDFHGMPEEGINKLEQYNERAERGEKFSGTERDEYENLKKLSLNGLNMTKGKIEAALRGEGKDANWANSYLEGYLYNTDPVIGGFAKFFKNNMIEMEARVQSRENDILRELKPLLDEAGITFTNIGELGEKIGFIDTVGYFDSETKEFIKKQVWTLLNPTKDYRFVVDKFNYDIKDLQDKYNRSGSDADKDALRKKIAEKDKHMKQWFYQKYVDEFYESSNLLEDSLGEIAAFERKKILDKISLLQSKAMSEFDIMNMNAELDSLWKEYRLLHSVYNLDGTKKTNSYVDDSGKVHYSDQFIEKAPGRNNINNDLAIAERLTEYRDKTKKFYDFKLREGAFENALLNFEKEIDLKIKNYLGEKPADFEGAKNWEEDYEAMFETYRKKWINKNVRIKIKPEFYTKRADIMATIKKILAKLPSTQANELDFTNSWNEILDVVSGYRDDDGQPVGNEIPEGRIEIVKQAQQKMEDAKAAWAGFSGLTTAEMDRMLKYSEARSLRKKLSYTEYNDYISLIEKQKESGLDEYDRASLNRAFAELNTLQRKEPTPYYVQSVNKLLDEINDPEVYKLLETNELDVNNVGKLYNQKVIDLLNKNTKFKNWFEKNHTKKMVFDKESGKKVPKYERLYVWNVIKPNDPSMYETTEIKRPDGTSEFIDGVPTNKYYSRVVKKEYYTGYDPTIQNADGTMGAVRPIVGVHRDNTGSDNGWLPKPIEGSPYYNERYFQMKNADPNSEDGKLFKILEVLKKHHLKNQEGLGKQGKLYLDFPRFEMEGLELLQKKRAEGAKEKISTIRSILAQIIDFFKGGKADTGVKFNWEQNAQLVRADAFNDQIDNIPIQGLANLDLKRTSTDIVSSMFKYLYAAEHQKQLIKMNPIAKGIKSILEDPNAQLKEMDKINRSNFINFGITSYLNKKGKYIRRNAFANFYDREFKGEVTTGWGKDNKVLQNIQRALFGRASFSFFAFNIPSALKNAMGAKFQAMIQAAGGTDVTFSSLAKGESWSAKYMMKLSFSDAYAKGQKSLEHQLGQIFDPIQGRFHEKFGTAVSRTMAKDIVSTGWFTNFRKWVEIQAGMQTFAGMMYKQQVEMNGKMVDYMDVWELNQDGKIQLKAGVDPKWGITYDEEGNMVVGEEFKRFKSRVHAVMNKLNGAYSKWDQPEAQRYIVFRFFSFLRRYFTTMAMNRFGQKRWNPGYNEIDEGYYVSAVKSFLTLLRTRNINNMTPEDKIAWMKLVAEVGSIYMMGLLLGLLWGWDDDDEERFAKLRERSSFLQIPGTRDYQPGEHFDAGGFLSLHAMNLMMQIRAENEQFLPGPGVESVTSMLDLKSLVMGPTIQTYEQIGKDLVDIWEGEGSQYYKRRVGPYEWQDQGGLKLWAHIAKALSLNASNIDPAQQITNFQKAQAMKK